MRNPSRIVLLETPLSVNRAALEKMTKRPPRISSTVAKRIESVRRLSGHRSSSQTRSHVKSDQKIVSAIVCRTIETYITGCCDARMYVTARRPSMKLTRKKTAQMPRRMPRMESSFTERSEEHTSELQSRVDSSYAAFCL